MVFLSLTHPCVPVMSGLAVAQMQPGQAQSPLTSSSKGFRGPLMDAVVLMCPKMAISAFSCPSVKARG